MSPSSRLQVNDGSIRLPLVTGSLDRATRLTATSWNTTTFAPPVTARGQQLNQREAGIRSISGTTNSAGVFIIYAVLEPYYDGSENSSLVYSFNTNTLQWAYVATSPVYTYYRSVIANAPFDVNVNPTTSPSVSRKRHHLLQLVLLIPTCPSLLCSNPRTPARPRRR